MTNRLPYLMIPLAIALSSIVWNPSPIRAPLGIPHSCLGCDPRNDDLHGRDLRNVAWVGVVLAGANLRDVNFSGAKLAGASFRGATLLADNFSDTNLQNADLTGTALCGHETNWNDGDVTVGNRIFGRNWRGADLRGADLRGAQLCDPREGDGDRGMRDCKPLDAGTVRDVAHANLTGAKGP